MPRASFVIPTRDCAAWLPFAVNSAISQTIKDIEIVIVNDGSTDSTGEYLDWLIRQEKRIRVIKTDGIGRSAARNLGNKEAQSPAILVLDADDVALPKRVEHSLELINKGVDYVYGSSMAVNALATVSRPLRADVFNIQKVLKGKKLENGIVHSSVAYTKELSEKIPYREGNICKLGIDDWAHQIEVSLLGKKIDFVPNIICQYRNLMGAISNVRNDDEVMKAKSEFLELMGIQKEAVAA